MSQADTHLKRKFVDPEKAAPEIPRQAVERVRALYAVVRLAMRHEHSAPLVAEFRQQLPAWKEQLLPKHPVAEAINYAPAQWSELTVFLADPAVPVDNNVSEHAMKRIVLNRKNSPFVGNPRGSSSAPLSLLSSQLFIAHVVLAGINVSRCRINNLRIPRFCVKLISKGLRRCNFLSPTLSK